MKNEQRAHFLQDQTRFRFFTFPAAIVAIIVGKAFWTCRDQIVDTDLWWHLRNAAYMLSHHQLPRIDSYSFTAAGSVWLDHSWLSELVYYAGYRGLGLRGVFLIFTVAVAILLIALFRICRRRNVDPLAAGIASIWGGLLAMVGFTPRAQNFGWLCFAAVFAILLRFRDERRGPLWLIPILFCLWINLHGGWPMGLVVFAIIFLAGLIRHDIGQLTAVPWTRSDLRRLLITFGTSIAALFINPFSFRLVLYPFDVALRQKLNVTVGGEWSSVNFSDSRGMFVMITLAAVFSFALLGRVRWRLDDVALVCFVLFCGLTHIRFLIMTGIVLPPVLVPHFGRMSTYNPAHERKVLNAAIMVAVAALIIFNFPAEQELNAQVKQFFPVTAANYLKAHPVEGNMFNQYEWGGYLEWALPQAATFIDTRTEIFEYRGVLKDYVAISTFDGTEELLDRYNISYVIYPTGTPLSYFLSKNSSWQCLYQDSQAIVYGRWTAAAVAGDGGSNCSIQPPLSTVP